MMTSPLHRALDRVQRFAARSPLAVRLAVLVRNQARCVIKYHLAESPDVAGSGEMWLLHRLAPYAEHVIDVGANVGDWTAAIVMHKIGDERFSLIACEPSRSAIRILRERYAHDERVRVEEVALGDAPGTLPFFEEDEAGKGSTLVPGFTRIKGRERSTAVTTLAELVGRAGWSSVDVMKIDAEGYDLRVIRGGESLLAQQRIGVLQFEYNRSWQLAGETLKGAYSLLERHGYRVFLLKRDGLYTLNYAFYEEYFEYSNYVAVAPAWMNRLHEYVRGSI